MKKRLVSFLLILMLLLSLGVSAYAEGSARKGDIVILYTSDIHCGIDEGFGYAGLYAVREYLKAQGSTVLLVDDGDNIQGEPVGTMSKGRDCIELMNQMGYDVAIPGNHEFDYGMDNFLSLTKLAKFPYISCNFNKEGALVFDPWLIKEADGVKIGFVGVTTPQSLTKSTPKYFQDENGKFIYGFMQDKTGEGVYNAVQTAIDGVKAAGADYVIVLGHMGNLEDAHPWTYADVISHTGGIDVFLDGHSHDTEQVVMKDKDGKEVPRSACGTKMACIGYCRIGVDGKVSCGFYTWNNPDPVPELLGVKNAMSKAVDKALDDLGAELKKVVASTAVALTVNDPTAVDANGFPIRMIRRAETNMGDFCADAYRDQAGSDIAFVNGGGIRADIPAGKITLNDILKVHPFGNSLCVVEVTGQQILDALEWSVRSVPNEEGSFQQVSGLSFEVHTYIPCPCTADENGMFESIKGEPRVYNIHTGGEAIDTAKTYNLAIHIYHILN